MGNPEEMIRQLEDECHRLREALLALVDVMPYLHPNPNALHALKWEQWKDEAIEKAAAALGPESVERLNEGKGT